MGTKRRRVVGIRLENPNFGTHIAPAAGDAIPVVRDATWKPEPMRVDREILRQTITGVGDIYPGKSLVEIKFQFELHANSNYVSGAGVTSGMRPIFTRVIQSSAYRFISEQTSTTGVYAYPLTSNAGTAPLRHLETVTGASTAGVGNTVVGDTYGDDGMIFVDHGSTALVGSPFTGADSGTAATVGARNVTECFAWYPESQLTDAGNPNNTQQTASITLWTDGKRMQAKGCMGNVDFQFKYSDAVICECTYRGVLVDYTDQALPTSPNEAHKYPPTFLGSRVTLRQTVNAPSAANKYGSDGVSAGVHTGALSKMTISTGNDVALRESAIDPNGVNYATITDRKPRGSFDPDEVLNTGFDFISRFVLGTPVRLRATVNGPGATVPLYNDPSTNNQNSYSFIAPGIVFDGVTDGDRESLQILDSSFLIRGGDYDTTALGELAGSNNELVILHY